MAVIEDIFRRNKIDFQHIDLSSVPFPMSLPEKVKEYLQCMGKSIQWHKTVSGSPWTALYDVKDLMDAQIPICSESNLLVVGNGLNGDLLTINLENNHVGYIFHDDLWEQNYSDIEDIYCELPFEIEDFLQMMLEEKTYPIDGTMAERQNWA